MAEDQTNTETLETKVPLRGAEAAQATLERLQRKGILPVKEEQKTEVVEPPETTTVPYDVSNKKFPTKEDQERELGTIPPSDSKETIPPNVKKELTEETRRLNTIAMGQGEGPTETTELPRVAPFKAEVAPPPLPPVEHLEAKGGAEPLRRIMKAQETVDQVKRGESVPLSPTKTAPEPEAIVPSHDVSPHAAPWIKKEQPRMVGGATRTAVAQARMEPPARGYSSAENIEPPQPMKQPEDKLRQQIQSTPTEAPRQSFLASWWNRIRGRS